MISHEQFIRSVGACDVGTYEIVRGQAKRKLTAIIEKFGDAGGTRLTDGYLLQLMIEEYRSQRMIESTFSVFTHTSSNRERPATA